MAKDTGTYQEYWQAVRDYAASAVSNEDWSQDVALADRVHELVDQSQWVIYTGRNLRVLEHTAHFDAYEDEGGLHSDKAFRTCYQVHGRTEVSSSQSLSAILTVSAYYAMQADVYEAIERLED